MSKPSFICIGAQKAGTTWLFNNLKSNPSVWMPPIKELHYFDYHYGKDTKQWGESHIRRAVSQELMNSKYSDSDPWNIYLKGFMDGIFTERWYEHAYSWGSAKGRVLGDITPAYGPISLEGVESVRNKLGYGLKIILMIRKPYERAVSQIKMTLNREGVPEDASEKEVLEAVQKIPFENRGGYERVIRNWERVFDRNNILYIPYGAISRDPKNVMSCVDDFVGADRCEYKGLSRVVHKTKSRVLPPSVTEYVKEKTEKEDDFLKERFGCGFWLSC